jgi:hypothetical protein
MPNYTPQPKVKDTPSRGSRKGGRTASFIKNKLAGRLQRKARKEKRDAIAAARAERDAALAAALETPETVETAE